MERVGEKAVRMEERRGVKEEKRLVRVECILVVGLGGGLLVVGLTGVDVVSRSECCDVDVYMCVYVSSSESSEVKYVERTTNVYPFGLCVSK